MRAVAIVQSFGISAGDTGKYRFVRGSCVQDEKKNVERAYLIHVAAATLLVFLAGVFAAATTPYFGGPDERNHYNSVVRVVDGGGWPLPYEAGIEPSVHRAWLESGRTLSNVPAIDPIPLATDRSNVLAEFDNDISDIDNMVQHPPLYYFLTAGAVAATGTDNLRWDQAFLLMRIFSVFLVSISVPAIAGTIRGLTRSRSLGIIGAYSLLTIPFFVGFAGLISNDTLLVPTISGALYLLVRAWRKPHQMVGLFIAAGFVFGLALLTKGFALFAIPLVFGLSLVAAFRSTPRKKHWLLLGFIPSAVAALVGGWWWIRNLILIGSIQPSVAGNLRTPLSEPLADIDVLKYFAKFWLRLNSLFWARGVRPEDGGQTLPVVLVAIAGLVLVAAVIIVVFYARNRAISLLLLSFPAIVIAVLFVNSYSVYETYGVAERGVQGRYVFGGIVAYSMVFASLWGIIGRKLALRARSVAFTAVIVGSWLIAWAHNWWLLLSSWPNRYSSDSGAIEAATAYFDLPTFAYFALTAVALVTVALALVLGSRLAPGAGLAADFSDDQTLEAEPRVLNDESAEGGARK